MTPSSKLPRMAPMIGQVTIGWYRDSRKLNWSMPMMKATTKTNIAWIMVISIVYSFPDAFRLISLEQLVDIFRRRIRNTLDFEFYTQLLQLFEASHVIVVYGDGGCNLAFPIRHVHIANVHLFDRHSALHQFQDILRCFADNRNVLVRRGLANDVDGLLDREEARLRIGRRSHVHQALTELVGRYSIVCNEQQVCPDNAAPLGCDLTMDQTVVDSRKSNIWHCFSPFSSICIGRFN